MKKYLAVFVCILAGLAFGQTAPDPVTSALSAIAQAHAADQATIVAKSAQISALQIALAAATQPATPGPKPVITQLQTTVIAGEGVEVNALTSTILSGTVLTTTYKWDFGDPTSKYNVLPGWNAGHVYDAAGTYTITLTLTDSAGHVGTNTSAITVKPDTRTVIFADSVNGSDANSGASPALAVKTAGKAFALGGSNTRIQFNRGQTFPVTSTLWIAGHDEAIGAYGTGANPVLMFAPTDGSQANFFVGNQAANTTIQGLAFDSPNAVTTGPANELVGYAIWAGGTNLVVRGNIFLNVEDAINATQQPAGVIVQDNSAPLIKGLRGYFCWVDGTNWSILGNTVVNTTRQHCVRVNASDVVGVLITGNNLTKQYPADDPAEAYKTTIDLRIGSYVYIAANVLTGSTVAISDSPGQTLDQVVNWVVFDGNTIGNAQLSINYVAHHVVVRNNLLNISGTGQISIAATGTAIPGAVLTDLTISHNTGMNTGQDGEFINVFGAPAPGSIVIDHNVYSAAGVRFGYGWDSAVWINAPDMKGFASITGNIWPAPNPLGTPNVVNWLAGAFATPTNPAAGYLTPQQWNGLAGVSGDQFSNQALPSGSYQLTVNGITAGAKTIVTAGAQTP
jgi:PKD repeat protein